MIAVSVRADTKVLDQLIADLDTAPVRFNALVSNVVLGRGGVKARIEKELTPYPGKPRYPLRWKSAKQRRAYFATNGFGRGIPYQRTNKLKTSWRIVFKPLSKSGGGSIDIFNDAPYARFVVGIDQQPFHADTGWKRADTNPALAKIQKDMTNDISEIWGHIMVKRI